MKKALTTVVILALLIVSCTKTNDDPSTSTDTTNSSATATIIIPSTSLSLTTSDGLGNTVAGSTVTLYSSKEDLTNKTNPLKVGITGAGGNITFDSLDAVKYYWSAVLDCMNNVNGSVTTTQPITAHVQNKITVVLSGTGILQYVNNSTNPYSLYVNGTFITNISGKSTLISKDVPAGAYSIRVLQNSGYAVYPTEKTVSVNLACGGSAVISIP